MPVWKNELGPTSSLVITNQGRFYCVAHRGGLFTSSNTDLRDHLLALSLMLQPELVAFSFLIMLVGWLPTVYHLLSQACKNRHVSKSAQNSWRSTGTRGDREQGRNMTRYIVISNLSFPQCIFPPNTQDRDCQAVIPLITSGLAPLAECM